MGGPNNLDEVKVFLSNMFNDKNIITVKNSFLRSCIAFMITTFRTKKAQKNYALIGGKSPLVGYTNKLVDKLQRALPHLDVRFAMRYTPPFCTDVIRELQERGIQEVTLLPLYPHYSTTTTKSSLEDFEEIAHALGFNPKTRIIEHFYEDKLYNNLLVQKIKETLGHGDTKEIDLIFSAHSLPQKIVDKGDPYQKEVVLHVELLKNILKVENLHFKTIHIAYQSKLGPVKWLEPSLEEKLHSLTNKKVLIVPLSFTIDNSETEFELCIEYKEVAEELGFEYYRVTRCPNDDDAFVECLKGLLI
jgi:ferrochelatase